MSSNKQNPLLQEMPVNAAMPKVLADMVQVTTAPSEDSGVSKEVLLELESEISDRNRLILERLSLENAQIDDYIGMLNKQRRTDRTVIDTNSYYYNLLNNIYTPLFFTYFVCLIVLGFFFFMTDSDLDMSLRVFIMVVFILYPFVIVYLEDWILSWFEVLYSYVRFTPIGSNPIRDAVRGQPFLYSGRVSLQDLEGGIF